MLKKTPDPRTIESLLSAEIRILELRIINAFKELGQACISSAKNNKTYRNVTGNLRESICFAIVKDGYVVYQSDTNQDGRSAIAKNSSGIKGICLLVLAGAEYAEKVEARGLDVITNSELEAERIIGSILNKLDLK